VTKPTWRLSEDRCFDANPTQRRIARELYGGVAGLPIVSPHGHVDPQLFADESASYGTPADLLIIPDHYVYRLLHSCGIPLEALGVPRIDGGPVETDHRKIWQVFADNFHLFRGTPTGLWLSHELTDVFGVRRKLSGETAQATYDLIAAKLATPAFRPRALFERFNIEVLCTTDSATAPLDAHKAMRASGWSGDVRPTFRPDAVIDLLRPGWVESIDALSDVSGVDVCSFATFVEALERRREDFKALGATATDQSAESALTVELSSRDTGAIFQRALRGEASPDDARRFTAHMVVESARMSVDDGLVMQFHVGSLRNYDRAVYARFGRDKGFDIPRATEFARSLRPLLNRFGSDPRLTLILFTLDESTYSRELAPLAGVYPALKLGPPWWFHDSVGGLTRYRERVIETAGLYNTVGFNDDTRAFPSIPARHDLARRLDANWIAGLVVRGFVDEQDAHEMMLEAAYWLAKRAYRLDRFPSSRVSCGETATPENHHLLGEAHNVN
jgi:glucuronate isomerase